MRPYEVLGLPINTEEELVRSRYGDVLIDKLLFKQSLEGFDELTAAFKSITDDNNNDIFNSFPSIFGSAFNTFGPQAFEGIFDSGEIEFFMASQPDTRLTFQVLSDIVNTAIESPVPLSTITIEEIDNKSVDDNVTVPLINAELSLTLEQVYAGGIFEVLYINPLFNTREKYSLNLEEGEGLVSPVVIGHIVNGCRLSIEIIILPHQLFRLSGVDLKVRLDISLEEALIGFKRTIVHVDGTPIDLNCSNITDPYTVQKIEGGGMTEDGDMLIRFYVVFPVSTLNKELLASKIKDVMSICTFPE